MKTLTIETSKAFKERHFDGEFAKGTKVRVVDKAFENNPKIWGKDFYVAWITDTKICITDNLNYPVCYYGGLIKKQLKKVL